MIDAPPNDQAVHAEGPQVPGLEVADEEPHGELGGHAGDEAPARIWPWYAVAVVTGKSWSL